MFKYLLILMLFVSSVLASDVPPITLTIEIAADSSDSGVIRDTTGYTEIRNLDNHGNLSVGFEIVDIDTNFADDSIFLIIEHALRRGLGATFMDIPTAAKSRDTFLVGAADTLKRIPWIVDKDSMWGYVRAWGHHSVTLDSAAAGKLAGNEYKWKLNFYLGENAE